MADNYLERKMEDLRSGRLSGSLSRAVRRPMPSSPLASQRVLVAGGTDENGERLVREFRQTGCRTAFLSADRKKGQLLAQECGARFYPCDAVDEAAIEYARTDLTRHWGGIDMLVYPFS